MKQAEFEDKYRSEWMGFEQLLASISSSAVVKDRRQTMDTKKPKSLDFSFSHAYRKICGHYALAQQRGYSQGLLDYLHELALQGHQVLYQNKGGIQYQIIKFVLRDLPIEIRREWKLLFAAGLLFYLPIISMAFAVYWYPELAFSVYSVDKISELEAMYDPSAKHLGREREADTDLAMFGFYISNNIGIGFQTVVTGVIAGLGTLFYLIYNGIAIGAAAGHLFSLGYHKPFISFVAGHSALELTGIVFAGAAGLKIGLSVLFPGRSSRLNSLTRTTKKAMPLVYGVILLLLLAAFVEAFWSSKSSIDFEIKVVLGLAMWVLVFLYCLVLGRRHEA